jgi:hypothetical protein
VFEVAQIVSLPEIVPGTVGAENSTLTVSLLASQMPLPIDQVK